MPKFFLSTLVFVILTIFPINAFAVQSVIINEILADPGDGQKEFVELYFPEGYFDVSTHTLKDKVGSTKSLSSIQTCGNFAVYELSTSSGEGWLNNSGQESVFLYDSANTEVDSYKDWKNPGEGKSLGRFPDGQSWQDTESPTKCAANNKKVETTESQPTSSNSTPSKSPSPTPTSSSSKSTVTAKPSPKTSPSPKTVLGEKVESHEIIASKTALEVNSPSPSPSPVLVEDQKSQNPKIPLMIVGSGVILMGLSLVAYLWYRKNLNTQKEVQNDEV